MENTQAEILVKLGLEAFWTTPLGPASMLDISFWTKEIQAPLMPKNLPHVFLQRLWMLSPEARSTRCMTPCDAVSQSQAGDSMIDGHEDDKSYCAVNPLDLLTGVYMSVNSFLRQEMTVRMVQCQFAVPLVLPSLNPEQPSIFLLWPLRSVVSNWRPQSTTQTELSLDADLASTLMPLVSCVKIGHCSASKSKVLSHLMAGAQSHSEMFLHRGMDGGQIHRKLGNGLVELGWYLPSGDPESDIFPVPVVISNLRGDAAADDQCLRLLCHASSALVVFCGTLREKDKDRLALWKGMASKLILIDLEQPLDEEKGKIIVGFVSKSLQEEMDLPTGSVLSGGGLGEEELAHMLRQTLNDLLPSQMKHVTLENAANIAVDVGLRLDEGPKCKNAMARVGEVLQGLEEGSAQFRETQLPLQGEPWAKLTVMEKEECKQRRAGEKPDPLLQKERSNTLLELSSYRMSKAMKVFTDTLFTSDEEERTYFLSWLKLRLQAMQTRQRDQHFQVQQNDKTRQEFDSKHSANEPQDESASEQHRFEEHNIEFVVQQQQMSEKNNIDLNCDDPVIQPEEPNLVSDISNSTHTTDLGSRNSDRLDPWTLGLEHFLHEMGLIFELTHNSTGNGSHNVLRLPSLAAGLLLHGIPLQIMDGDASDIPTKWLGCVLAEFNRCMPRKQSRVRVLANIGAHHAGNSDLLFALFGVSIPGSKRRFTKGIYMLPISVPDDLREEFDCDFLMIVNVEGLCGPQLDNGKASFRLIRDNEMATVATGVSDILIHNIASFEADGLQPYLNVVVNALLRTEVCGFTPICQLVKQDDELTSKLQALQLARVAGILQTQPESIVIGANGKPSAQANNSIPCVTRLRQNASYSERVHEGHSEAVVKVKQDIFAALQKCGVKSKALKLPELMCRLSAVWEEVKAQSFSITLENTEVAQAFCMLCTELSQWEHDFLEDMERWFLSATMRMSSSQARTLESEISSDILVNLKDEAREEVKTGVHKMKSQVELGLMKDNLHKTYIETYRPNLLNNLTKLQEQTTKGMIERLESAKENLYSSTQLESFQALLAKVLESKHNTLTEASKLNNLLLEDAQLDEEFEDAWNNALSNINFRPSKADDITARVTEILRANLINRKLQKHLKKLEDINKKTDSDFVVCEDHFGYRSRMKHIEDNNRQQRIEAHQLACNITKDYNQYVFEKSSLLEDFSNSYIEDVLENVEKALTKAKPTETKSVFEVDLKVYLCSHACQDFQKIHDRYAKDTDLLTSINGTKNRCHGEFIYQFRKRDQCRRMAQAFTTMSLKPTALSYIYSAQGTLIMEAMIAQDNTGQYLSPWAFNCTLLEELLVEDSFESYLEYLHSFDKFCLEKIQEKVVVHLSASKGLEKWRRQQRLGEVIGKMAAAVSQAAEGVSGVLSDTKLLLEKVCINLEIDGDVEVPRETLDSPLFSITTEWDRFVSCLLETLAELRLALAQEFSQDIKVTELLRVLPVKPQDCLFCRVRGCEKRCPFCKAPCAVRDPDHQVHWAWLHRPKGLLSYTCDNSCSLSHMSCPADIAEDNLFANKDTEGEPLAYRDYHTIYPDWSLLPLEPGNQKLCSYWRYVMVRFNERFAEEYEQKPANLPEEWKKITQEEALGSLNEIREKAFRPYDTEQWLGHH
ncbi:hypothetical protein NHX12_008805 [Muraenolepis orangiensis]|uniref:VLIG-type G domain-containing protein n=1 Tax=Muraenolepis orangiensis TaxID=630683 RepID=A0A9Q0DM81_9TELE|nr:hypothetical protein NHX12_008805 [Muraenolepis orangiensis]